MNNIDFSNNDNFDNSNSDSEAEPIAPKKRGPKGPHYENGCRNNPNSKSYRKNNGAGRGKIKEKTYKNKVYQRITIVEYNELIDFKNKYLELLNKSQ